MECSHQFWQVSSIFHHFPASSSACFLSQWPDFYPASTLRGSICLPILEFTILEDASASHDYIMRVVSSKYQNLTNQYIKVGKLNLSMTSSLFYINTTIINTIHAILLSNNFKTSSQKSSQTNSQTTNNHTQNVFLPTTPHLERGFLLPPSLPSSRRLRSIQWRSQQQLSAPQQQCYEEFHS